MSNSSTATASQPGRSPLINVAFGLSGRQLPADHGYLLYSAISRLTDRGSSPTVREGAASAARVPPVSPLHKAPWLAIELISGFPSSPGLIALSGTQANGLRRGGDATLRLRIPADHYRDVLPLAGKRLDICGHQIRLDLPVARPIEPAPSLYARVVTIKKFTEPEPFLEAVKRKLDSFGVQGRVELPHDVAQTVSLRPKANSKLEAENSRLNTVPRYRRRIITIHGKSVVGFSIAVHDLNDEDSLLLQAGAIQVVSPDDGSTQWQGIFSRRAMGCGIFNPILAEKER